jgi:hypothetical protein
MMKMTGSSLTRFLFSNTTINKAIRRAGFLSICALLLGCAPALQAQGFQFGIDFTAAFPQGEFKRNVDSNGYGIGGQFLYPIKNSPFLIGADLGYVTYGSESFTEQLSPTIPEVRVRVKTTNNIFTSHFVVRAQKPDGKVRPYVEGLIGLQYLFTRTAVSNDFNDEEFAADTNFSDSTFSVGAGAGVQFLLTKGVSKPDILLDTKVRYLRGSQAEYLRKGSIFRGDGEIFFEPFRSPIHLVNFQVGVTFRF